MDTGSLIDLVTSVDLGSLQPPIADLIIPINAIFKVIGDAISVWPSGSYAANSSVDAVLGSVGTVLGSIGGQ